MKRLLFVFLVALLFLFTANVAHAATYPDYTGYVNDYAQVFSPRFVSQLNTKLSDFNTKTTNQIAVVTVNSTQPETIEEYSIHLADKWKVGQKGKDNGIIMLFAMQDHKMRIEVGRGLEGDITDVQSKHIQSDVIVPLFKKGDYEQGVANGVNAVIATITHNTYVPSDTQASTSNGSGIPFSLIFFIIFIIILAIAHSPFTPLGGAGIWGLTTLWDSGKNDDGGGDSFGGGGFSGGGSSDSW